MGGCGKALTQNFLFMGVLMKWPFVTRKKFNRLLAHAAELQRDLEKSEKLYSELLNNLLANFYQRDDQIKVERSAFEATVDNLHACLEKKDL